MNVKDSILTAGVALLREKGIAALTQPQVAGAAGIKQSHLTYYFPTRADLLLGIAERSIADTIDSLTARLAEQPRPADIGSTLSAVVISGIPPRLIVGLIVAADAEPEIRPHLRKLIRHVRRRIRLLLDSAGLASDAEAALLFHATIVGLAIMHQARLNAESTREVRSGIAALLRLLGTPKGESHE